MAQVAECVTMGRARHPEKGGKGIEAMWWGWGGRQSNR